MERHVALHLKTDHMLWPQRPKLEAIMYTGAMERIKDKFCRMWFLAHLGIFTKEALLMLVTGETRMTD